MDAALRQRLVGALVLIALAVIFLPMLLDGKREIPTQQVDVDLPPPSSQIMPGDQDVTVPAQRQSVPTPDPEPVAPVIPETEISAEPDIIDPLDSNAPAASAEPASSQPITRANESEPATRPEPPAQSAPPRFERSEQGRFAVSFGSYGQESNAKNLVAQLSMAGLNAISEAVQSEGKTLYRVRAIGFANRTQAESARQVALARIRGTNASIVELPLSSAEQAVRTPSSGVKAWAVQVGVFSDQSKALQLRDRLRRERFAAFVENTQAANGAAFRVRVGPMTDEASARDIQRDLQTRLTIKSMVVTHP
jgi:cell division septation protein DedD